MSETAKTMTFLAVALVALLAGWASRPASVEVNIASRVGEDLTQGFTDPAEAKRLKIVEFNEDAATLREFEVAEEDGLWTIPSKNGYPADAERQFAEAATSLMDRKILAIAGQSAADHEQFGVIDPISPKLEVGQKGVGTHVSISNIEDKPLVDLIVGRAVKDATNDQHYVREANRDVVYIIEVDPTGLSTNFESWIEKDLLKLNAWDIQQVEIKDYTATLDTVLTPQGLAIQVSWNPRSEMTLAYYDTDSKWTAEELRQFDESTKSYTKFTLSDDQELNGEKLDALKTALDDLAIVDVDRKPAGLSADLKAGVDFLDNPEARKDLRTLGFATVATRDGGGGQELISSEGEVIVTMKDGVEYVLRFGDLRLDTSGADSEKTDVEHPADATAADKAKASDKNVQRYLFAMARFNEDAVKQPQLAELPPLPEEKADAAPATESEKSEAASSLQTSASSVEPRAGEPAADPPADAKPADPDTTAKHSPEYERILAERQRIETDNQRQLDEYNALLEKGRQQVNDLNLRFGDWYFVVSNDTFQKVRLGKDDVVKQKDAKQGDAAQDTSAAGAPGTAVPGLPSLPGTGN